MKLRYTKKICFVSHGLGGGGMERALVSLANDFVKKNHEVTILNIYNTEIFFDLDPRIQIIWPKFKRQNRFLYILRLLPFIRNQIRKVNPDVVFSFGETFNSYVIISTRFLNHRLILTNRMWPLLKLGFPSEYLNRFLYRLADGVISQTTTAKDLIKKNSFNSNITVIPNAVVPIETITVSKKKQIISVGRLSKAKGHSTLLNAFARLPKNDWTLHLVGDGSESEHLKSAAVVLGVSDKTFFHGHLKDFSNLLAESEIFVLPSFFEGFPNALIEAMSVPLACISSNCVAGPSDIIQDGINGMLFETGNNQQLADRLLKLMNDLVLRENLAKEAYKVRQDYEFNKIADSYLKFLLNE